MELIRHADLRTNISIKLKVLRPYIKKESGLSAACTEQVIDAIMDAFQHCVVVRPNLVGYQLGRFGVTEPHPCPQLLNREERAEIEAAIARGPAKGM